MRVIGDQVEIEGCKIVGLEEVALAATRLRNHHRSLDRGPLHYRILTVRTRS